MLKYGHRPFPESIVSTSASACVASRGRLVNMTDADMFIGRSAPWSSSGMGASLGESELRRGRWGSVLGSEFGELFGELAIEVGFIVRLSG